MLDAIFTAPELNGWLSFISLYHLTHLFSVLNGLSTRLENGFACICESDEVFVALNDLTLYIGPAIVLVWTVKGPVPC